MDRICLLNELIKFVVLHVTDIVPCTHLQQIRLEIAHTSTKLPVVSRDPQLLNCLFRLTWIYSKVVENERYINSWKSEKASFTHSFLCSAVIKQPSHVAVPETLIRSVGIFFCVTMLVVVPVGADPLRRITLRQTASVMLGPIGTFVLRIHVFWLAVNNNPFFNLHCRKKEIYRLLSVTIC